MAVDAKREDGTLVTGAGGARTATLTTRNRQAVLNRLQSEFYDNIYKTLNDYYKDVSKRQREADDEILSSGEKALSLLMSGVNLLTKSPAAIAGDLIGGALSSTGDAVFGVSQMVAKFVTDAWAVLNEGDGRGASEDLSYMVSSAVGNIAKGLGTIAVGGFASLKTMVLGDEDAQQAAAVTNQQIENFINTEVIGRATQKGREMDQGPSSEQDQLTRMYGQPKEEQPFEESEFNDAEYARQYIDERYSKSEAPGFVAFTEAALKTNGWYQNNIAKPIGTIFDDSLPPEYKKWVEPAVNSIGRLVPAVALSIISSGAATPALQAGYATASKAFFVSNVYGQSYASAVESGAAYNDAHIYAQANMLLELGTEMIGGWKAGNFNPQDVRNIIKSIRTEAMEEGLAEIAGDGLNYWLSPDRQVENVDPSELWGRVAYSAIVGGLSGGLFGGIGKLRAQTDMGSNASIVAEELDKVLNPKDGSKPQEINQEKLNKATKALLKKLNDPKVPDWRKQEILENKLIKELVETEVNEVESPRVNLETGEVAPKSEYLYTYKLSDIGQRISEGKVFAKQGQQEINKEDYAVGAQEFLFDYLEEIPVGDTTRNAQGEVIVTETPTKIEILKNEEVKNLNEAQQQSIEWFRNRNIRVAFIKGAQKGSFAAFTDPKTGMIYVNVNSINNESGFKNVFAHEMHDKMNVLFKAGKLTKKQMDAYVKFQEAIDGGQLDNILNQIGWNEVAELYTKQTFTQQQKDDVEKFGGWDKVPLTPSQKSLINREKISWVVGEVFDNNTILRRAFGQNPGLFRSIANIFANNNKFKTQFNITGEKADVKILSKMLDNMQKNFQQLLIEGNEFAFGYESIGDTFRLQRVMNSRPGLMFSYEITKPGSTAGSIIAKTKKDVIEATRDEKAILNVLDIDENSKFYINEVLPHLEGTATQPIDPTNKRLVSILNIANKGVTFLEGNEKQQIDAINGGDYFLKIGNQLYDRNKFNLPQDIKNNTPIEVTFQDGIFEIFYERNPKAAETTAGYNIYEDIVDYDYPDFNKLVIYPDFIMKDGTIKEKAHMLISSVNPGLIDDIIKNDGKAYAQSIAFVAAGKSKTMTQQFERMFADKDHLFTITMAYNPQIVSKPGYMVFQKDAFTPIRIFYDNDFILNKTQVFSSKEIYDNAGIDPNESFVVKQDMTVLDATEPKYTKLYKNNPYLVMKLTLKDMMESSLKVFQDQGIDYNVADLDVYSAEAYASSEETILERVSFLTNEIVDFGQSMLQNTTGKPDITPAMLKDKVGQKSPSLREVVQKAEKAANAINSIFRRGMSRGDRVNLMNIGQAMAIARFPNIAEASQEKARKAYAEYSNNKKEYEAILDFYNTMNYQTNEFVVEMQASEMNVADDVAAVNINHFGGNKNSAYYQKIKSFFESKGVKVIETVNEKTVEKIVEQKSENINKVTDKPLMTLDNLKNEDGSYNLEHPIFGEGYNVAESTIRVQSATQSVMDNLTEEGINSEYLFAVDKKKSPSKRKKSISASDKLNVEETTQVVNSTTKTTARKFNQARKTVQRPVIKNEFEVDPTEIRRIKIQRVSALKEQLESLKKERALALENNNQKGVVASAQRMKTVQSEIKALEAEIEQKPVQQEAPPTEAEQRRIELDRQLQQEDQAAAQEQAPVKTKKAKPQAPVQTQEAQPQVQETTNIEQRKEEIVQEVMGLIGTWSEQQTRAYLETKRIEQGMEVPLQDSKLNELADEYSSLLEQDVQAETQQEAPVEQTQETVEVVVQEEVNNAPVGIEELEKAYEISKRTSKATYKALQKAFKKILDSTLSEVERQPEEEFKEILDIYKRHNGVIRRDVRGRLYINHISESMLKALVDQLATKRLAIKKAGARTDLQFTQPEIQEIVDSVYEAIFSAMAQMDDITSRRYITEDNPTGRIYNRFSHRYLRDFLESDILDAESRERLNNDTRGDFFRRLISAIYNINDENGIKELKEAINEFIVTTEVDKVNILSLNEKGTLRTIPKVKQEWQRNAKQIKELSKAINYKTTLPKLFAGKKLIGSYSSLIDPFTFLEIQSLFDELGWGNVLAKNLEEGVERQIDIDRLFEEFIQSQNWLKENFKDLQRFDNRKKTIVIENLSKAKLTMTQIITLRNNLIREILRNRAIDAGIILGEKSRHFENGNFVEILALFNDNAAKLDNAQKAKIVDQLELLNELNTIVESNPVASELSNRIMTFFSKVYPLINERYSEINGQPLQSEGLELQEAITSDETLADVIFNGLPENINLDMLDKIYIPIAVGQAGYFSEKDTNLTAILNVGVSDGFTQEISSSNAPVKIDSILQLLYKYKKEARNYWGLHTLMQNWNDLVNEELEITPMEKAEGQQQSVNMKEYISAEAIDYVEEMLLDVAGYRTSKAIPALSWMRKNLFRAALAANAKVILTQLTTMYNLAVLYGDNFATFFPKMYKNLFMQLSEKNKAELAQLKQTNNIYYDRTFAPTYDIGEAQDEGNTYFNKIINFLMSGISGMDTAVNNALYITLLETVNSETGTNFTRDEANAILKKGILRSQSSALDLGKAPILRTENDIYKSLLKFMGEPLKLQSQIYASKKQLELIRKLNKKNKAKGNKTNQKVLEEEALEKEDKALQKLLEEQQILRDLQALEENVDFATLENDEQKKIRDNIKIQESKVAKEQEAYDDTVVYVRAFIQQMRKIIDSKARAQQMLRRRIAALMGTMMYMSALNTIWYAILKDMGNLDDREEEEELFQYLSRKFAVNLFGEFFGLIPFIRDIYGFIVDNYDIDSIDEISLFQNGLGVIVDNIRKLIEGEEIKPYEMVRDIGVFGLKTFGFPASNIENFATIVLLTAGGDELYYKYRDITGQRTASNKELTRAVKEGNDEMVQAIVESKINSRNVSVSTASLNEFVRLGRVGVNVSITGIKDSYVIDGVEYKMDEKQLIKFRGIYNQADLVVQRMISSSSYRRLNDNKKASLIQSIYNYYLRRAQSEVFDLDLVPDNRMFRSLSQAFIYFRETVATRLLNQQREEEIEARRKR